MKEKISKKTIAIVVVTILIISVISGVVIQNSIVKKAKDEKNIYMSLCYLKQKDYENAEDYLEQVRKKTTKKLGFVKDSAEIIRQYLIGNQVLLEIKLDILQTNYKMDENQETVARYLLQMSEQKVEEEYDKVIKRLIRMLDISEKKQEMYELEYEIESSAFYNGYVEQGDYEDYKELYDEEAANNLRLSVELSTQNYKAAFREAVKRVEENPSDENKLLLADIVARSSYNSYDSITEEDLYNILGEPYDSKKRNREEEKFEDRLEELQEKIEELSFKLQEEADAKMVTKLDEQLKSLYIEVEELENRFYKGLVYKALNAIETISSLEAEIVKAKLYYVLNQKEKAEKILLDSVDSIEFKMSDNVVVKEGLEIFNNLAKGTSYSEEVMKTEVTEALEKMLNYVSEEIKIRDRNTLESTLVSDLNSDLLSKYKYMNNDIYITSFDASKYPTISMTLNAREEILEDIVAKKDIVFRDTHYDVGYEANFIENILSNICFVVDISGSMGGTPLDNAKEALISFSKQLDKDIDIALVEFDDSARIVTELSGNIADFISASEQLTSGGGTEISAGIRSGIEALKGAVGMKNIILMTDGQSYLDDSVIEEAKSENVTIYTVGFGSVDSDMLKIIAEETGGIFTLADSSNDLLSVYESIGMMIGNSVELTYTVSENSDEKQRYVYVASEEYVSSGRHIYMDMGETTEKDHFPFDRGYAFSLENMETLKNNNEKVKISLPINDFSVETIEIGNQILKLQEEYGEFYVEFLPITKEGLYDITVVFSDGMKQVIKECILVYDEELQEEIQYVYGVRIGCLLLGSNQFYKMSDGTIVLHGARFNENKSTENSLSASTNNLVILDSCTISTNYYGDTWKYDWGEFAQFHLDGIIYLEYDDAQNYSNSRSISAMGKLSGEIDLHQCTIKTR